MDWGTLPKELLSTIFSYSSCNYLTSVACVNSTWNACSTSDNIWKEAAFNESFPHSSTQKDVPWRQIVLRHLATKRNIIKRRCVQFTLGNSCPASNPCTDISMRTYTVSGKYALIRWEIVDSSEDLYVTCEHLAIELWDLEKRVIAQSYPAQMRQAMLSGQYLLEGADTTERMLRYSKFDPKQIFDYSEKTAAEDSTESYVVMIRNEDPNSSLAALTWEAAGQRFVQVSDLRTGSKVYQKSFRQSFSFVKLYGGTLVSRVTVDGRKTIVVTNLIEDKEVILYDPVSCLTVLGNDLWMVSSTENSIITYNIVTGVRHQYLCKEDIKHAMVLKIIDGIIWLCVAGELVWLDVSASTCRVLAKLRLQGHLSLECLQLVQMPNGAVTCLSSDYAHILSFRNEDIEQPIQVLQIEPNGQNKAINIPQGDLNTLVRGVAEQLVAKKNAAVLSQIVSDDENQRYCVIFSQRVLLGDPINEFAEKMKKWPEKVEYHKTGLFRVAYFDFNNVIGSPRNNLNAHGPCWVFFETKVDGGWLRSSPPDQWHFVKSKLGIE